MIAQFLYVTGSPDALAADNIHARVARTAAAHSLSSVLDLPGQQLCANEAATPIRLDGDRGFILGSLFRKHRGYARVSALDRQEDAAISAAFSETLSTRFWGNYVAISTPPDAAPIVLRAPFGGLPAYVLHTGGLTFVASHLDILLAAAGAGVSIEWPAIARHLIAPNLRPAATCVSGVTEILGGFELALGESAADPQAFWHPWRFTAQSMRISDSCQATERLARLTRQCVTALAVEASHVVLGISGGLDSSIVAACLAESGTPTTCLTLYSGDPSGDERCYARELAGHLGLTIFERAEFADHVDVTRSDAAHLPRPVARSFAQSGDRSNLAIAAEVGADQFFSGGGGDNVFAYIQSAVAVADRLITDGPGMKAWHTARDISRLADCSQWAALRSGIERAWFRDRVYRWKPETGYLTDLALRERDEACTPIWSDAPDHVLPGSSNHVAWLVGIQNHIEGYSRERTHPMAWPLLAQPLVELCLSIPSWMWSEGGHNRMIARRAFADSLPKAIVERRTKGTPDSFAVEIFERNRTRLADMLVGGRLASHGLIDDKAIARQLRDPRPVQGHGYWRIMGLADVEAWLHAVGGGTSPA